MRQIKFRCYSTSTKKWYYLNPYKKSSEFKAAISDLAESESWKVMQFTGLKDCKGAEIYESDILQFSDKWEWYKCQYGPKLIFSDEEQRKKIRVEYEKEPYERRVVTMPECYEWMLSSEIQSYWEVIGNIYQHKELLE